MIASRIGISTPRPTPRARRRVLIEIVPEFMGADGMGVEPSRFKDGMIDAVVVGAVKDIPVGRSA